MDAGEPKTTGPFLVPADGTVRTINFSGGRSSAYLLYLPAATHVVFCNTGKELPQTLDFVQQCSEEWDVPIVWLEYRYRGEAAGGRGDPRHGHVVVDYESASRNGEPFEALIRAKRMLPNVAMRFCTSYLKVRAVEWYLKRDLGVGYYRNILGIRFDEPKRWIKAMNEECLADYPLVLAKVDQQAVQAFWSKQPFDLGIPSWQGNCDLCFLKGRKIKEAIIRSDPSVTEWWSRMERTVLDTEGQRLKNSKMALFSKRYSVEQLASDVRKSPGLPLAEGLTEEDRIDCFCGD